VLVLLPLAVCALVFYSLDARLLFTGADDLAFLRHGAKLAFVVILAVSVWLGSSRAASREDWRRLCVAFALVLVGDTLFFLRLPPAAIPAFMAAQVAFTWRNGRGLVDFVRAGRWRERRRRVALTAAGSLAAPGLAAAVLLASAPRAPSVALLALAAAYALFLAASLCVAWLSPLVGALPRAGQVAAAMTIFFCCDLTVGLGGLLAAPEALVARSLTWVFYVPALGLLAASGRRANVPAA